MHRTPKKSQEKSNASTRFRSSESHWEQLMRKFSDDCKQRSRCKSTRMASNNEQRPLKRFATGSSYKGTWNKLVMNGFGIYRYSSGVEYEGEFQDGEFHGEGLLRYPSGITVRGKWVKGQMRERTIVFADEIENKDRDWKYCTSPDRRFFIEYSEGLRPAGNSVLSADQPTKPIPEGHYDTGDGFYDSISKVVYSYDDKTAIVRIPHTRECEWIEDNCRSNPDKNVGPCSHLYEEWIEPRLKSSEFDTASRESSANDLQDLNNHSVSFGDNPASHKWASYSSSCSARRPFIKFDRM